MHYLVTTNLTYVLSNATCYEKLLNKEICYTWTSPIPSARIFPISRATNLPSGSNLALNASPICLTISPLLGAGICKNVTSSSSFSFQLYLMSYRLSQNSQLYCGSTITPKKRKKNSQSSMSWLLHYKLSTPLHNLPRLLRSQ